MPCPFCGKTNFIDFEYMARRNITKTTWDYGFTCAGCKAWVSVMVSNQLADESLRKLKSRKVDDKFPYHLAKTLRRIISIREQVQGA